MCLIVCEWIKMSDVDNETCNNIWNVGTSTLTPNFKEQQTASYGITFFTYFIIDILHVEHIVNQTDM